MYLSDSDKERILQNFPHFKLSYEKHHKKIYSHGDFFLTIPRGLKYFAWFQHYKKRNVCFFLQTTRGYQIQDITVRRCCFNADLCFRKGTILYGTMFINNNTSFFNIENIYYFKNQKLDNLTQRKKFTTLSLLFKSYIKQVVLTKQDVLFGLPILDTDYNRFIKKTQNLSYELYCIQHRLFDNIRTGGTQPPFINEFIKITTFKNFTIKAKIAPDIYELYENMKFVDIAYIPDYKTSVFMNSLFRKIKENLNLDALEESDDEEEFENTNEDKYVYLDKSLNMKCVYLPKFKKWKPIEVLS